MHRRPFAVPTSPQPDHRYVPFPAALPYLNQAEAMLQRHLRSLSQAANAFSMAAAVVRWAGRITRKIDSGLSGECPRESICLGSRD
jgi:hypothetical protein